MFDIHAETNGEQDCTKVIIHVETDLPCHKSVLLFDFDCGHQYAAQLLLAHINRETHDALSAIRTAAYQRGRTDAKRKQRQIVEFATTWDPADIGW